jgi:phospholipid/cholesterol/gamma-HCH transport system substrate-binding protein
MQKQGPTITRILIAFGFAISCFGLALFLWIAFGGPVPLKPESYRITVPFDEATTLATESDVRISGISVGKVKSIELGDQGLAEAELEVDATYAPLPADTKAIMRQKTLLGETYVELTPGSDESLTAAQSGEPASGTIPEGGTLPEAQVSEAVQLDEIFRAFDEKTRGAFQAWMQGQAAALRGRGDDLSVAIASLDPFAEEADDALRLLDSQRLAVRRLVSDGGEVFEALSERRGQLRGLIQNSNEVFTTTANRNVELAEAFRIFPTFLRESRATLTRLDEFASDTDPLVQQLRPAARELSPTLIALGELAPELEAFFVGLRSAISAARPGLPAVRQLLDDDLRPLLRRIDPYFAELNSILEGLRVYRREVTGLVGNLAAASNGGLAEGGHQFKWLRTEAVLNPDALAAYPRRLQMNRTNPYLAPGGIENLAGGLLSYETRQCATGIDAELNPADAAAFPGDLFDRIQDFAFADVAAQGDGNYHADDVPAPGCTQQPDQDSIGVPSEQTQYPHAYAQGAP